MTPFRLAMALAISLFAMLGAPKRSCAQMLTEPDKNQAEARQRIQKLLSEPLIDANLFQTEMPLAKFLAALEAQLPQEKRLSLRIDKEAFGDDLEKLSATPMVLPPLPQKRNLHGTLLIVKAKSKINFDYRIGSGEVVLTTPEKALYTAVYDVRDLIGSPVLPFPNAEALLHHLVNTLDQPTALKATKISKALETIETLNEAKLVLHTNATRHADVAFVLQIVRRLAAVAVSVEARLYEVDQAFYTRLKNVKRISIDEMERRFLQGKVDNSLFDLLKKQKMILAGEKIKPNEHETGTLLSWHQATICLASPEQQRKGEKAAQIVLPGVSFLAVVKASPDRRSVRMKFTERATELLEIRKNQVYVDNTGNAVDAETPLVKENTQTHALEIPDGGSLLVPVLYRPRDVGEKNRWWVLSITPRIHIEEEEQQFAKGTMDAVLPHVVADVLKNPLLKTARDFYGTPGDQRFALVNSASWTWPEQLQPEVAGHQLAQADQAGNRLLGIRVDSFQWLDFGKLTLAVTLVNAGGNANGAVIGGCTIHYTPRPAGESWKVELVEK